MEVSVIMSQSKSTELVDSVCMHHLHVVDADLAPLPRGTECARVKAKRKNSNRKLRSLLGPK